MNTGKKKQNVVVIYSNPIISPDKLAGLSQYKARTHSNIKLEPIVLRFMEFELKKVFYCLMLPDVFYIELKIFPILRRQSSHYFFENLSEM